MLLGRLAGNWVAAWWGSGCSISTVYAGMGLIGADNAHSRLLLMLPFFLASLGAM
jgi:hypothetical protein